MRVFVPFEEGSIDSGVDPLVPYRCGVPCAHGLSEAFTRDGDGTWRFAPVSDGSASRRPASGPTASPGPR